MLNLLLVEDNEKLRHALKVGLEATGDARVVGEVASGEEALAHCLASPPDVALMDVQLSGVHVPDDLMVEGDPACTEFLPTPDSAILLLFGLGGLVVRQARTSAWFGHLPGWYHSGGPSQVGYAFALEPTALNVLPRCLFDGSAVEDVNPVLLISLDVTRRGDMVAWAPSIECPRGPPA